MQGTPLPSGVPEVPTGAGSRSFLDVRHIIITVVLSFVCLLVFIGVVLCWVYPFGSVARYSEQNKFNARPKNDDGFAIVFISAWHRCVARCRPAKLPSKEKKGADEAQAAEEVVVVAAEVAPKAVTIDKAIPVSTQAKVANEAVRAVAQDALKQKMIARMLE